MSDPALVDGVLSSVQRSRPQRATMKRSVSVEELPTTKSQVIAKRRRKQKPKSKVPAQLLGDQSGSAISGDAKYDEIFDAVISQVDEDIDDIDVDDDVHDSTLVGSLKNEIVELRGTIHHPLQAKVDFLRCQHSTLLYPRSFLRQIHHDWLTWPLLHTTILVMLYHLPALLRLH